MTTHGVSYSVPSLTAESVASTVPDSNAGFFGSCCTLEKMRRLTFYFFSAATFATGSSLLITSLTGAVPLLAGVVGIPLYILSYFLGKEALNMWDYDDPRELLTLRQQALESTLLTLTGRHGWQTFFRYAILSPANFTIAFHQQARNLDVNALILMHKRASEGLTLARQIAPQTNPAFVIPDLTPYQTKFHQEVRDQQLTCDQILHKYNIEDLFQYGFIPDTEIQLLRQLRRIYDEAVRECRIQIAHIDDSFRSQTSALPAFTSGSLTLLQRHLGLDVLSAAPHRNLTPQQLDQRRRALFFHQAQLQTRIDDINARYNAYRSTAI